MKNKKNIIVLYLKINNKLIPIGLFSSWWNSAEWINKNLKLESYPYFILISKTGLKRLWYLTFYTIIT